VIQLADARVRALATLELMAGEAGVELALIESATRELPYGFAFFYQSRAFVETGDVTSAIGGNGPLVVLHSGVVEPLGSHAPADVVLEEFASTLPPITPTGDLKRDTRRALETGATLADLAALLHHHRAEGMTRPKAQRVLESLRPTLIEADEDRVLEMLDMVTGFAPAHLRVWDQDL